MQPKGILQITATPPERVRGIGAVFAEIGSRLGVRNWVLIDDDAVDDTNLNRLPGATRKLAKAGLPKVDYVSGLIRNMWPRGARIRKVRSSIEAPQASRAAVRGDILVVATDNHLSRLTGLELGLRYLRPVIQVGVHIDKRADGSPPRLLARATAPPLEGGWCPVCTGALSLAEASREASDAETQRMLRARGYLTDVPAPAVFWLNAMSATLAVRLLHGDATGFDRRLREKGVDWILDAEKGLWLDATPSPRRGCYFCDPSRGVLGCAERAPDGFPVLPQPETGSKALE